MTIKRRQFTKEFKLQVLHEIEAGLSIAQAARQHQLHPNLIRKWREQVARYAARAFAGNGHVYTDAAKVAELERLIGQLTVENAFLKKVLNRLETKEHR
jgi:transposase